MQSVTGKQSTCTGLPLSLKYPVNVFLNLGAPQPVVIGLMVLLSQFIYCVAFRLKSLGQEQFLTFCAAGLDFTGDVSAEQMQPYHCQCLV